MLQYDPVHLISIDIYIPTINPSCNIINHDPGISIMSPRQGNLRPEWYPQVNSQKITVMNTLCGIHNSSSVYFKKNLDCSTHALTLIPQGHRHNFKSGGGGGGGAF